MVALKNKEKDFTKVIYYNYKNKSRYANGCPKPPKAKN